MFAGYKFSGPLRPGYVSPMEFMPSDIPRPDYALDGTCLRGFVRVLCIQVKLARACVRVLATKT